MGHCFWDEHHLIFSSSKPPACVLPSSRTQQPCVGAEDAGSYTDVQFYVCRADAAGTEGRMLVGECQGPSMRCGWVGKPRQGGGGGS